MAGNLKTVYRTIQASLSNIWLICLLYFGLVLLLSIYFVLVDIDPPIMVAKDVFLTFWSDGYFLIDGIAFIGATLGIPLILLPLTLSFFLALGTYEQTGVRRRHLRYVVTAALITLWALFLSTPLLLPKLMASQIPRNLAYVFLLLNPLGVVLAWMWETAFEKYRFYRGEKGMPILPPLLNPSAKPLKGWQVNLDIGAVAPRIGAVVDGLDRWSRFFESSAPTSETIWAFVRNSNEIDGQPLDALRNAGASYKAVRGIRQSAWRGVDELRRRMGKFLGVEPEQIVFVTSTTRALEVSLIASARTPDGEIRYAPEVVYIPTFDTERKIEHDALLGRLAFLQRQFGTEVRLIELFSEMADEDRTRSDLSGIIASKIFSTVVADARKFKTLVLSHVTFAGGIILPVQDLVRRWKQEGRSFRLIIDGAHAVGQIPVTVAGSPDFYVFSGHKWMLGPAALGIIVLRNHIYRDENQSSDFLEAFRTQVFESLAFIGSDPPGETAATVALDPLVGTSEALSVLTSEEARVEERLRDVREIFRQSCLRMGHVEIINFNRLPVAPGMVLVQKKDVWLNLDGLKEVEHRLEKEHRIVVKTVAAPYPAVAYALRICLPFYLSRKDIISIALKINDALGRQS